MAYGQTGSGKTYTMLGSKNDPGIAPRAFERLFQLAEESRNQQITTVSTYMLELYNDKLVDLLKSNHNHHSEVIILTTSARLNIGIDEVRIYQK